jgi:16S rRNA A1518/A1519 N6-dimethyltransferase RsmA/KsgA/DIM1 with predicted DNA glycosylase/AP lyase activity
MQEATLVSTFAVGSTPEGVVAFRPSPTVEKRVVRLVKRSKAESLSAKEQSELEGYLQLEHIMIMARARARQYTNVGR